MARPLSEDKRNKILAAATALVAEQGLSAATAEIAKRAGVPNGSIFTYFDTKVDLLNAVFLDINNELAKVVLRDMPAGADVRAQLHHMWKVWTSWGAADPQKRRALAQLCVSDQVTDESRKAAGNLAAPILDLIARASAQGPLCNTSPRYVGALADSMASTTIDFMINDPIEANRICEDGFEALWHMLA